MMNALGNPLPAALVEMIHDCAEMIDAAAITATRANLSPVNAEPLPSLLEQCHQLTDRLSAGPEPVRTIHHFACTGGTLIAKCLACMPNTQLLSEIEPFSRMQEKSQKGFHPTDLIQLVRHSSRGGDNQLEAELFLAGLKVLWSDCSDKGLRLVLRDHAHSKYCVGAAVADTPALRELVKREFPERAIVTVRHPLDSFLSLQQLGWLHFEPPTLEEYCRRYLCFLDDHGDVGLFRYEDFVERPEATMQSMCETLRLPFADGFMDLFGAYRFSGDSGRSSDVISARPRRPVTESLAEQVSMSPAYGALCQRVGYPLAS